MADEIYIKGKRDPNTGQKRPTYSVKGDLFLWQTGHIDMAKEFYLGRAEGLWTPLLDRHKLPRGKRDLFLWQTRPIPMAKEAY